MLLEWSGHVRSGQFVSGVVNMNFSTLKTLKNIKNNKIWSWLTMIMEWSVCVRSGQFVSGVMNMNFLTFRTMKNIKNNNIRSEWPVVIEWSMCVRNGQNEFYDHWSLKKRFQVKVTNGHRAVSSCLERSKKISKNGLYAAKQYITFLNDVCRHRIESIYRLYETRTLCGFHASTNRVHMDSMRRGLYAVSQCLYIKVTPERKCLS